LNKSQTPDDLQHMAYRFESPFPNSAPNKVNILSIKEQEKMFIYQVITKINSQFSH
jgi:hypothetical protein